jgi:hypothetical protein
MPEPLPSPAEELAAEEATEGLPRRRRTQEIAASSRSRAPRRAGRSRSAWARLALGWLVFVIGIAWLAPILPLDDPINVSDPALKLQGRSGVTSSG